jgi:hypothetical protein
MVETCLPWQADARWISSPGATLGHSNERSGTRHGRALRQPRLHAWGRNDFCRSLGSNGSGVSTAGLSPTSRLPTCSMSCASTASEVRSAVGAHSRNQESVTRDRSTAQREPGAPGDMAPDRWIHNGRIRPSTSTPTRESFP